MSELTQSHSLSTHASSALQCKLVPPSDWSSLRTIWDALYARCSDVTPWQSWSFVARWWSHMRGKRELRIYLVEQSGQPLLLVPLQLSISMLAGLRARVLEPIGMPDDINRPRFALGDYSECLYRCALEHINSNDEWDALRLDEKRADDWEVGVLRQFASEQGFKLRQVPQHPCPFLDLRQHWPEFLKSRGTRLQKNLRAAKRRLEARGPVQFKISTVSTIEQAFATLLAIHQHSWKQAARIGLCQSLPYQRFYKDWVNDLARSEQVQILTLYSGQRPVAATLAVHDRGIYYSAQIAHDDAYADCSPGTLLESMELEHLMATQRFAVYDFLGAALNNKRRWTDTEHETFRVWLFRRSFHAQWADAYYFRIKPWLRRLSRRERR